MFMCLWENSHFLCIKHTQTPTKNSVFLGQSGTATERMKVKMLAVPVTKMFQTSMRLLEVIKTMTPVLMMLSRAGHLDVLVCKLFCNVCSHQFVEPGLKHLSVKGALS